MKAHILWIYKVTEYTFKWLICRTYPFTILIAIVSVHIFSKTPCMFARFLCFDNSQIDNFVVFITQLLGGFLLLLSLNSNLEIFQGKTLLDLFKHWWRTRPLAKQIIEPVTAVGNITISKPEVRIAVNSSGQSVEQQLKYINSMLQTLSKDIENNRDQANTKIANLDNKLFETSMKHKQDVSTLEKKVTASTLGGVKLQLLGLFLVIYGSYVSAFFT
ncbi:MAG: hypothetical protein ACJAV1_002363 [Paraglaciecola sp.]|jgi:hypothetical protein